jgi:pilus assembly protein TadC
MTGQVDSPGEGAPTRIRVDLSTSGRVDAVGRRLACVGGAGAGVLAYLLVGGWPGGVVGVVAGVVGYRVLRRLEPARVRREREVAVAALPFALDLLGGVLRAGLPVGAAVRLVAGAVGGPLGARLTQVGEELARGATPALAWTPVTRLPGGGRLAAAVVRAADSGAALASAFSRLADDLRGAAVSRAQARAQRAGVLLVLPLGLCFLPAFVVAGVVPVIVAVLGDVLR